MPAAGRDSLVRRCLSGSFHPRRRPVRECRPARQRRPPRIAALPGRSGRVAVSAARRSRPDTRYSSPAPQADAWQPSASAPQAGVQLSAPEAGVAESRDNVRLQPPATTEPPVASAKPGVIEQRIPPAASPSLPVGIPEFAVIVPEKVTAGQKPALEAFDWLKSNTTGPCCTC